MNRERQEPRLSGRRRDRLQARQGAEPGRRFFSDASFAQTARAARAFLDENFTPAQEAVFDLDRRFSQIDGTV